MDARRARLVHPAYVEIVKQLCPDEARIFTYLNQYPDKQPEKGLPYFDIHIPARDGYDVIDRNISHLGTDAECEHAELTPSYIDNLCRLELLGKVTEGSYIADPKAYKRLEKDPDIKAHAGELAGPGVMPILYRRAPYVTTFGRHFIKACVLDD